VNGGKACPKPSPFIKGKVGAEGICRSWQWDTDHQEKEAPAKRAKIGVYQVVNERSMGTQKDVSGNATKLIMQLRMKINWALIVSAPFLVTRNLSPLGHWFKPSWGQWLKKVTRTWSWAGKVPVHRQTLGTCASGAPVSLTPWPMEAVETTLLPETKTSVSS